MRLVAHVHLLLRANTKQETRQSRIAEIEFLCLGDRHGLGDRHIQPDLYRMGGSVELVYGILI